MSCRFRFWQWTDFTLNGASYTGVNSMGLGARQRVCRDTLTIGWNRPAAKVTVGYNDGHWAGSLSLQVETRPAGLPADERIGFPACPI